MNKQKQLKRQEIRRKRNDKERTKRKEFLKWRHSGGVKKYLEELGKKKAQTMITRAKEKKKLKNRIRFVILFIIFVIQRIWLKIKNKSGKTNSQNSIQK